MADFSLPDFIQPLINRLESAGFPTYAVGGCIRDMILNLPPHDYDLCTAALPEQIEAVFQDYPLVLAGKKHGTVGVVTDQGVTEITTFRTEGDYLDNRHPLWVQFVPSVEEDLARRDFTVNAMAYSPIRGFADPFGGQKDLICRILRAVGDPFARFREDSLRILRGVRFSVRYHLIPDNTTLKAMNDLAPLIENLARERVFDELCKILPLLRVSDLAVCSHILACAIPELKPMIGFDQHSPHHAYDLFTHTAHVVAGVPPTLSLRWAALLHDTGKIATFTRDETGRGHFYGHAAESAEIANRVLLRLKAPTALREQVVDLIELHMDSLEPDKKLLRRRLSRYGEDTVRQLLLLQQADMGGKGTVTPSEMECFPVIRQMLQEILREDSCLQIKDLAINGNDLIALGLSGPAIGRQLHHLLQLVMDEAVPNTRQALLDQVRQNADS